MLGHLTPTGTTPAGTETEQQASSWVQNMFDRIAPRYDLLNHLLSLNIDRHWRSRTVAAVRHILEKPGARVLDVCCGTGDLTVALEARARSARVFGTDFSHRMLAVARGKSSCPLYQADGLELPIAEASFDLVTVAFGFRNFANYQRGLTELRRVLRPGGTLAILEFTTPSNPLVAQAYGFYSRAVLPAVGGLISGSRDAYTYLPESVRKFPDADGLAEQMRDAGFAQVRFERMTVGIVALHLGERS